MDQGMHVSGVHLRFMDHHLMGSGYSPSLPPSLPLSIPRKKGYIPSGEGVGGYKTAAMSFDGDGIHSLANTENKIPEIPKLPVCVGAARERSCDSQRYGGVRVSFDARFEPHTTNHEGRIWGHA